MATIALPVRCLIVTIIVVTITGTLKAAPTTRKMVLRSKFSTPSADVTTNSVASRCGGNSRAADTTTPHATTDSVLDKLGVAELLRSESVEIIPFKKTESQDIQGESIREDSVIEEEKTGNYGVTQYESTDLMHTSSDVDCLDTEAGESSTTPADTTISISVPSSTPKETIIEEHKKTKISRFRKRPK